MKDSHKKKKKAIMETPSLVRDLEIVDDQEEYNEVENFLSSQDIPLKSIPKKKESKGFTPCENSPSLVIGGCLGKGKKNIPKKKTVESTNSINTLYSSNEDFLCIENKK
jgi:hypothetical protein